MRTATAFRHPDGGILCPACGRRLAVAQMPDTAPFEDTTGNEGITPHGFFLTCTQTGCPLQGQRYALPTVELVLI